MNAVSKLVYRTAIGSAVILVGLTCLPDVSGADQPSLARGRPQRAKTLDEQLLDDLSSGPVDRRDADDQMAEEEKAGNERGKSETRNLDEDLLDGLEGEDILTPAKENPLVRLNQRMRQVERRIAETKSDEKTQRLQHEISDDISKLIAQAEKQCSQCKKSSSSASSRPRSGEPKPGTKAAEQASDKPAQDSSSRMQDKPIAKVDREKMQAMLKDFWGHLPPHLRQQMEQSANEEFLPKYELEIAEYYRSLLRGQRGKK